MPRIAIEERGLSRVWWLHPAKLGIFFLIPLYTLIFLIPQLFGAGSINLKFFIYFTEKYYWIGLAFLVVLVNGALIGSLDFRVRAPAPASPPCFNRYYLDALALLTVFAYLLWYRNLLLKPSALLALFSFPPDMSGLRAANKTIGGVTTLTQLAGAYAVLYLTQVWGARVQFEAKRYAFYLYCIIAFVLFRVYAWGERLAFIELMVPVAVMYVVYKVPRTTLMRVAVPALPVAGVLALVLFFGVTEYFRSWQSFYQYQGISFQQFIVKRLVSYYYTALNNGAGLLAVYDWPNWRMPHVFEWLYRFPFLLGRIVSYLTNTRPGQSFLDRYADPEFNNMSGIFMVIADLGLVGGLLFAAVVGGLVGYLWRSLVSGKAAGIYYPVFFLGLLEIFRVLYISQPRAFPTLLALLIGHLLFRSRPQQTTGRVDGSRPLGATA